MNRVGHGERLMCCREKCQGLETWPLIECLTSCISAKHTCASFPMYTDRKLLEHNFLSVRNLLGWFDGGYFPREGFPVSYPSQPCPSIGVSYSQSTSKTSVPAFPGVLLQVCLMKAQSPSSSGTRLSQVSV